MRLTNRFALFSWRIDFNKGIKSSKEDSFYKNMKVVKTALKVWQANFGLYYSIFI